MKVFFPRNMGQKYYAIYYTFVLNLLKFMNLDVELYDPKFKVTKECGGLILKIENKRILIDYWDLLRLMEGSDDFDLCFKYHYTKEHCSESKNAYPLGMMSFQDWGEYFKLEQLISYNCNNDRILHNQRARHGGRIRRSFVREMLEDEYGNLVDTEITEQVDFWMKINSCLIRVCVPGQRNDILDRGQFQYMAFGACTISPKLNTILPYMKKLEPGIHYIECTGDYSNLIEKIEWCKQHRGECVQIGRRVKKLFSETCTPDALWQWMCMALKE